jgi:isocitrate/isopropylmalate dehydrogenase
MLVEWLGEIFGDPPLKDVAADIERAVFAVLESQEPQTPDLGGSATTNDMKEAILGRLAAEPT